MRERTASPAVPPPLAEAAAATCRRICRRIAAGDDAHRLAGAALDRLRLRVEEMAELALDERLDDHAGTASIGQTSTCASAYRAERTR